MKHFFKKLLVIIAILATATTTFTLPTYARKEAQGDNIPTSTTTEKTTTGTKDSSSDYLTNGDTSGCRQFLGMPSWDCNLPSNWDQSNLQSNIWIIASNVADAITKLVGYLALGFIIYGGYLYIFSSGDPGKAMSGKKTLIRASIGLAIVGLANVIVSSAGVALLDSTGAFKNTNCATTQCTTAESLVGNAISWFIGIAGVVTAIYAVVGGIGYITAAGDPGKLQKSRATLYYAFIGLVIVGLSYAINNFVIEAVNAANNSTDISGAIVKLINTVIGVAGIVAVIYLVKGGVGYMTSVGDAGKLKKAKDTILYACIGLIVCALAFALTNWAVSVINSADKPQENALLKNDIAFLDKTL